MGKVADAKHADQGFQLVGQRHHHTDLVARQGIAGKTRLVMVFNGVCHRLGHSGHRAERVITAHDAL